MKTILSLISLACIATSASADLKKINGTWKPISGEAGGRPMTKAFLDKMVIVIKDGTYDYDEGNGHDIGTLKDVPGKPQGMDITGTKGPNKGKTYVTLYKLEGKTLTICYGLDGKRPKAFDAKGKGSTMLIKYQRS